MATKLYRDLGNEIIECKRGVGNFKTDWFTGELNPRVFDRLVQTTNRIAQQSGVQKGEFVRFTFHRIEYVCRTEVAEDQVVPPPAPEPAKVVVKEVKKDKDDITFCDKAIFWSVAAVVVGLFVAAFYNQQATR